MKPILLIICLGISMIFWGSCQKASIPGSRVLSGSWELRSWVGGYGATGGGSLPPGNGTVWKFTETEYWYYYGGQAHDSGQYQIVDTILSSGQHMDELVFPNSTSGGGLLFQLSNNNLILYRGQVASDGTIETYARLAAEFNPSGPAQR